MEKTTSQPLEFEGKTVNDAIDEACKHFSVTEYDLHIEIITKGASGIFGLGGKKARINASIKTEHLKEKEKAKTPAEVESDFIDVEEEMPEAPEIVLDTNKSLEAAIDITREILRIADLNAQVDATIKENKVFVEISGDHVPLIIGKDGQTLNALEYIVNRIIFNKVEGSCRVKIDADGYKARKEESLARLAQRKAEIAIKDGRSIVLDPMNPAERRIIHLSLKEVKGIKTISIGTGHLRRVVIKPLGARPNQQRTKRDRQPTG
jgi:spoIIIJ-associated protein